VQRAGEVAVVVHLLDDVLVLELLGERGQRIDQVAQLAVERRHDDQHCADRGAQHQEQRKQHGEAAAQAEAPLEEAHQRLQHDREEDGDEHVEQRRADRDQHVAAEHEQPDHGQHPE